MSIVEGLGLDKVNDFFGAITSVGDALGNIFSFIADIITVFSDNSQRIVDLLKEILKIILDIFEKIADTILLNKETIVNAAETFTDIAVRAFQTFIGHFGQFIDNFDTLEMLFFNLVDAAGRLISNIFEFGGQVMLLVIDIFDSLAKFLLVLPKFINSVLCGTIKVAEVINTVVYFLPAFLIFLIVIWSVRRIEGKINQSTGLISL
jgi:hypothetical protein